LGQGQAGVKSSSSGSFSFSRAAGALAPADAAAGIAAGAARRSHNSAPQTPWRLRDYEPSPAIVLPQQLAHERRRSLGQPALASALDPSPLSSQQHAEGEGQLGTYMGDDDDDNGCNDYDGGFDDGCVLCA
jgi:hypothetical protein